MSLFFLIIEILIFVFALYLFFEKKELAIIYLPALIFAYSIIVPVFSASMYYAAVSLLILGSISYNQRFYLQNIFAFLLLLYFLLLLTRSGNFEQIWPYVFSVFWLFLCVPLIAAVYKKFDRGAIFQELANCALLILSLFIANVVFSTLNRYAPAEMYGITSGILYGNLYAANFNVLTIAIFITAFYLVKQKSFIHFAAVILTLSFLLLSMRRSVMLLSAFGVLLVLFSFLTQREAKKFLLYGGALLVIGLIVYYNTDFVNTFNERYALRNLEERDFEGEGRFMEYELLYNDMFVYHAYSPWFGYELFNSSGNYGRGIFETRTLHSDLTNIAHSSGLLGVLCYLMMALTAFFKSLSASIDNDDRIIIFFCAVTFVVFTITGRYTQVDSMILLYLLLLLPLAKEGEETEPTLTFELNGSYPNMASS